MKNYNHKRWLEFLQRAADLPLHYSLEELKALKETADAIYPGMTPLIAACISLARGEREAAPTSNVSAERSTVRNTQRDATRLEGYVQIFLDSDRFAKNSDVLIFAREHLSNLPDYRFDKMSRQRIAQTIASCIVQAPKLVSAEIDADLGISKGGRASEFLTTWERTIKSS